MAINDVIPFGEQLKSLAEWIRPKLNYLLTRCIFLPKLKSDSAEVRSYAAEALGEFGNVRAIQPLIETLNDIDSTVRRFSISSLGHLRDARAIEPILAFLNDKESDMRCAAAVALGEIGNSLSVDALIATLKDTDRSVCSATVVALGKIGNRRAIEPLNELAERTTSEWIRRYVSETLHQIDERGT